MLGADTPWTVASWVVDTFSDPTLLLVFVAGIGALGWFWVTARIDQVKAHEDAHPADDLV